MTSAELFNQATDYHRSGDLGQAERLYRQILDVEPAYPNVHSNLGVALLASGRANEALACLRQAVALNPNQPAAHINLGNALARQGQLDGAIACFREALRAERPGKHG
jgi:protein O-GlcNAc transferase